jgi:uncharacterized membrane protein YhaH (DUF805 family)
MDFPQAIVSVGKKNYINSAGRASRSEYWYWALFCFLGGVATQALDQVLSYISPLQTLSLFWLLSCQALPLQYVACMMSIARARGC